MASRWATAKKRFETDSKIAVGVKANVPASLLLSERKELEQGGFVELIRWKLPKQTADRPHGYKYRLAYVRGDKSVLRYDNETSKGDHRIVVWSPDIHDKLLEQVEDLENLTEMLALGLCPDVRAEIMHCRSESGLSDAVAPA